jgi:hypothetical protein
MHALCWCFAVFCFTSAIAASLLVMCARGLGFKSQQVQGLMPVGVSAQVTPMSLHVSWQPLSLHVDWRVECYLIVLKFAVRYHSMLWCAEFITCPVTIQESCCCDTAIVETPYNRVQAAVKLMSGYLSGCEHLLLKTQWIGLLLEAEACLTIDSWCEAMQYWR